MKLAELQHLFWRSVRHDPAPAEVDDHFLSSGRLSGRERMGIYRQMYWYRIVDVLIESFPRVVHAMGVADFTRMASRYIAAHPSENPAIERVGFRLPEFMQSRGGVAAELAPVAQLEWMHLDAFIASDAPGRLDLAAIDPERFPTQRFVLSPSLRIAELPRGTLALWAELDPSRYAPGERTILDTSQTTTVAVWRQGLVAHHCSLRGDEARALDLARRGALVAEACEVFGMGPAAARVASQVLRGWFERGWVVDLVVSDEEHHVEVENTAA